MPREVDYMGQNGSADKSRILFCTYFQGVFFSVDKSDAIHHHYSDYTDCCNLENTGVLSKKECGPLKTRKRGETCPTQASKMCIFF